MTPRERILASLHGQERDRVPWIPLCSVSFLGRLEPHRRKLTSRERLKWRAKFCNDLGIDYMGWMEGPDIAEECPRVTSETRKVSENESVTEVTTPVGTLTNVLSYQPAAYTSFSKKHYVETLDDLKVASFLAENTKVSASYDAARDYLDALGGRGVVFCPVPPAPVQDALLGYFKLETTLLWVHEENKALLKYERLVHELNAEIYRLKAGGPFEVFLNYGVLGLALASPKVIRRHYLPFIKEYNETLKSAGKVMICHTSGEPIGAILDDIAEAGLGALCGLSYPAPHNTPEIWEIAKRLPPGTVLCGGPTPDFLCRAKPSEIKDLTRRLLEKTAGNGSFLLGTADDVVPNTPVKNLAAISETVAEFS